MNLVGGGFSSISVLVFGSANSTTANPPTFGWNDRVLSRTGFVRAQLCTTTTVLGRKRIGARRLRRFSADWSGGKGFLQPLSKSNAEAA